MLEASTYSKHSTINQGTNMSSTTIYTPYFYIIHHKTSKKMYAGARWAEGCHLYDLKNIERTIFS